MDKTLFEKYINEMRAMKASAMPEPARPAAVFYYGNDEDMTGSGTLKVRATSVRGLYPVEGARVTVFTGNADNMTVVAEGNTDISGASPEFTLPAPAAILSESPDPKSRPYALYNLLTEADGFTKTYNYNVAVFDGVTSLQAVELIPLSAEPDKNRPIVIDEYEEYTL